MLISGSFKFIFLRDKFDKMVFRNICSIFIMKIIKVILIGINLLLN